MRETFVIVGAGLTGGSAVVCLREERFQGGLVLIGAEPEVPYERPPLCVEMRGVRDTSPLTRTDGVAGRVRAQSVAACRVPACVWSGEVIRLPPAERRELYDQSITRTGGTGAKHLA